MLNRIKAVILAILIVIGVCAVFAGCNDGATEPTSATQTTTAPAEEPVASPDETGAVIDQIVGFTANSSVEGVTLPYEVKGVSVVALGAYTGAYFEEISDEPVENVMALVVINTSQKAVQVANVKVKATDGELYNFSISTLPKGTSVLVLEADKKEYNPDMKIDSITADVTESDGFSTSVEDISIFYDDAKLNLINQSDKSYHAVYVRYKNFGKGNVFMGGITYSANFESVEAGGSYEYEPGHYSPETSYILIVQPVEKMTASD